MASKSFFDLSYLPPPPPQPPPGWHGSPYSDHLTYTGSLDPLDPVLGTLSVSRSDTHPFRASTPKGERSFFDLRAALEWVEKQAKRDAGPEDPPGQTIHLYWARMSGKTPCGKPASDLTLLLTTRLDGQGVTCPECVSWYQNEYESKRLVAVALVAIQEDFEIAKAGQLGARFCVPSAMLNVQPLVDEIERLRALVLKPSEKT